MKVYHKVYERVSECMEVYRNVYPTRMKVYGVYEVYEVYRKVYERV